LHILQDISESTVLAHMSVNAGILNIHWGNWSDMCMD